MIRYILAGDNDVVFVIRKRRFEGIVSAAER